MRGADEEQIAGEARRGDRDARPLRLAFGELDAPVGLAVLRVETDQSLGVPDDELADAARLDDHRRRIADFLDRERLPLFLAGILVEGHDRAAFAADQSDDAVAFDQWM